MFEADVRFLSCQFHVLAPLVILSLAVPFHALLCFILIEQSGLGEQGVTIANCTSQMLLMLAIDLYCYLDPEVSQAFPSFQTARRAFENLGTFLKITFPSALMQGMRYWAMELTIFISGMLDTPSTSAASVILSTWFALSSI